MSADFSRRDFLQFVAAAAVAAPAGTQSLGRKPNPHEPPPEATTLTACQDGPQVWVRWANAPLTCYRAHPSQKYPYMYPLAGPASGLSLTAETSLPWPHHRSLLFSCDSLNGGNYWLGKPDAGQIISTGLKLGECTPQSAEIFDACQWQKPGGPVVMKDQRKITVTVVDRRLRLIDWDITWTAVENVTVTKTNHSLFAVRVAADLTPFRGGTLVNAEGRTGEQGTAGKPSAWCDFYGKRANLPGIIEGIAILDHPKNPWAPCPWFTRDYGYMSPTPMFFVEESWKLAAGKSLGLRYRVVLHAGDPKDAGIEAIYRKWVEGSGLAPGNNPQIPKSPNP